MSPTYRGDRSAGGGGVRGAVSREFALQSYSPALSHSREQLLTLSERG